MCSACLACDRRDEVDWDARRGELVDILERARHRSEYDCIVPSSGGKDSHAQVMTLLDLGARPLVVTATTCHLTPIGRRNIDNLARYADTLEVTPNRTVRAKLNRLALELVGDISWPEHCTIFTTPFQVALRHEIPLVFYGESPLSQYGGPSVDRQNERRMTRRWVAEFGGFLGLHPADFIGMDGITHDDMKAYAGPDDEDLDRARVEVYFLGQFIPWDSHENARVARNAGMEQALPTFRNWWSAENLDNAQIGIHDWMMELKYGYGRACAQMSVDIRAGRISRDDALVEMERREALPLDDYCGLPVDEILGAIGLTREQFDEVCATFTNGGR